MKANAIARIVIYSILILVLTGVLLGFLGGEWVKEESEPIMQTEVPVSAMTTGIVTADTKVYSAPSAKGNEVALLTGGEEVQINRVDRTNDEDWALISAPCNGWVLMNNIDVSQGELTVGPVASGKGENASMGAVTAQNIQNLEIDWAAGSVTVQPGSDTDTIRFRDDHSGEEKYQLYYVTKGDTLKIDFCEGDWDEMGFGIHLGTAPEKNLVVEIPENTVLRTLEIDAASAKVHIRDLTVSQVELDTASGAAGFENCNITHLDVDTGSGNVTYSGSLTTLDCDSASASIVASLTNVPQSMEVDTASGDLDITLPENAGFSASLDAISGKFQSDFDCVTESGRYVCGDRSCRIEVSAMSGNVHIRKHANAEHHQHTDACTSDPGSCPDYAGHVHSDACTSDPGSCPDNQNGEHHEEKHHG